MLILILSLKDKDYDLMSLIRLLIENIKADLIDYNNLSIEELKYLIKKLERLRINNKNYVSLYDIVNGIKIILSYHLKLKMIQMNKDKVNNVFLIY